MGPVAGAIGTGLGVAGSLFGQSNKSESSGHQQTVFKPTDEVAIRNAQTGAERAGQSLQDLLQQLQGQASRSVPQLQTNLGLNTNFQAPSFGGGLNPESQQLLALEQQRGMNQIGAQQRQISQNFRSNPALANILNAQLTAQNQLSQNPLVFQAQQAQDARAIGRAQAQNEAQSLGNQALLAQGQFGNNALNNMFQLGQSSRGEQAQYGQQNAQAAQNIYNTLMELGKAFATTHQGSSSSGRSGGLL